MSKYTTIRSIISLTSVLGWNLHQMDLKTSFLNGEVEEEVYIDKLEGFDTWEGVPCVQVGESPVWVKTLSSSLVCQNRQLSSKTSFLEE